MPAKQAGDVDDPKRSANVLLIVMWYSSSVIAAKLNYMLLKDLGSAVVLSLFQQSFVSIAGTIILFTTRYNLATPTIHPPPFKPRIIMQLSTVAPLAATMTLMSISYNSAMTYIPVSFLNTIKSTIPLWTSMLCWLLHKKKVPFLTQLSLVAIVGGVGLASATELGFHPVGFMLGVFSALNQTFFNLRAKSILMQEIVTPMQLQVFTAIISSAILAVIIFIRSTLFGYHSAQMPEDTVVTILQSNPMMLLLLGGLNYFAELRLSYAAIGAIGSLGYSIADVFRRLIVICSSVIIFGNPIQLLNIFGVCIALIGILLYNLSVVTPSRSSKTIPEWASKKKIEPPVNKPSTPTVVFTV